DGIRDDLVTGVQTCALPISRSARQADRRVGARERVLAETCGARRSPGRGSKKHRGVAGDATGYRALLMATVTEMGPRLGIAPTRSEERRVGKEYRIRW